MLTPEQDWAKAVHYAGWVQGHVDAEVDVGTVRAVDAELTALRTALEGATAALKVAREVLHYYAYPKIEIRDGDAWERIPGDGIAQRALAAIDAALGKEEALK